MAKKEGEQKAALHCIDKKLLSLLRMAQYGSLNHFPFMRLQ
jgi:hypothetical protein